MTDMLLAVLGAGGRMGRALIRAAHHASHCIVAGGTEAPGFSSMGADLGELVGLGRLGVAVTADPLEVFARVDGVLDFTTPSASVAHAAMAAQARIVHVIGTTGFSAEDEAKISAAGRHATIIKSGNMSLGVNMLVGLARQVAAALDDEFDVEVVEMHHRHKVDAPSGTALMLARAAAEGRGVDLDSHAVRARDGHIGQRRRGDIGFAVLRGGDVVGDHTVIFAGDGERLELTSRVTDREIFAKGAVKAALWGRGKPPGVYSMQDVLGF
jgi:4-hydroxy-tetrahydrodipicolinate reductase